MFRLVECFPDLCDRPVAKSMFIWGVLALLTCKDSSDFGGPRKNWLERPRGLFARHVTIRCDPNLLGQGIFLP